MTQELNFTIYNRIEDLEYMNFTVRGFLEAYDITDAAIFKVNLVLEELITNIIKYGYENPKERQSIKIHLFLEPAKDEIYLRIEDHGVQFDPMHAPVPETDVPIEDMKVGGLGIHLVRNIISKIEYAREEEKNIQQIWLKLK